MSDVHSSSTLPFEEPLGNSRPHRRLRSPMSHVGPKHKGMK